MEKCVAARAPRNVVAPCCVGKISLAVRKWAFAKRAARGTGGRAITPGGGRQRRRLKGSKPLRYPRSHAAASAVSTSSYVAVAKAADFGGEGYDETTRGAVGAGTSRTTFAIADSSEEEEDAEADAREAAALALAPIAEETKTGSNPSDAASPRLSRGFAGPDGETASD